VDKYTDIQLQKLSEDLPNDAALHQGLRILARIIAKNILANKRDYKRKKILTSRQDNENIS